MKIQSIVLAALLATASASSFATTYRLGNISAAGGFSLDSSSLSGAFSDRYIFSLANVSDLSASVTNSFASQFSGYITDFTVTLAGPGLLTDLTLNTIGNTQLASGSFGSLVRDANYVLTISGTAQNIAYYGGSVSVANAVPEPQTYLLLLAGLGVAAVLQRRRGSGDQVGADRAPHVKMPAHP